MKFIVDESSGAAVAEYLRSIGQDVLAVAEVLPQADDQDILARAAAYEFGQPGNSRNAAAIWPLARVQSGKTLPRISRITRNGGVLSRFNVDVGRFIVFSAEKEEAMWANFFRFGYAQCPLTLRVPAAPILLHTTPSRPPPSRVR